MIDPQQLQHRRVQIVDVDGILDDVVAEVVGAADGDAGAHAAAGEPHREGARMVVAAEELRAVAGLVHRRAAELAAPDDQRVVEQPALLEVGEQPVDRPVGLAAEVRAASRRCPRRRRRRGCPSRGGRAGRSGRRARRAGARAGSCWRTTPCPVRCRTARGSTPAPSRGRSAPARSSACDRRARRRRCAS